VRVLVKTPGSRVEVVGSVLRIDEIATFTRQLEALYRDLTGTAELECLEPALRVKVACGPAGHIQVIVDITPDHLNESHEFRFAIDQTYLPATLAGCKRLLDLFPIRDPDQVRAGRRG
jgi:hypothetical protein